jgi:hypothetical protein
LKKTDVWVPHVSEVREMEWEGQSCLYEYMPPLIRLQVGHRRLQAYIMAFFKQVQNYNGTGIVSWIVMAFFENMEIIMAQI